MPLYEYQCDACGHRFEKIQKFSDPHVKNCPKCGAKVEQVISAPAVQFKGAGWYVNDYAKKSSGNGGKSDVSSSDSKSSDSKSSESKSSESKSSESKSESKSETKSDTSKSEKK